MNFAQYVKDNTLDLQGLTNINIEELINFLQNNSNITSLDLSNCNIGTEGVKALAKSQHLSNLKHLDLSSNEIGTEGAKALGSVNKILK